jgi:taurine dioxygenase
MTISIIRTDCALGAEIRGVDLTQPLETGVFAQIRQALLDHEVIFFRGQKISDEDQIRFSRYFGNLRKLKRVTALHPTLPEIFLVSNIMENGKPIGLPDAGLFWHTDGAYLESPPFASVLRAIEVPHKDGKPQGDTVFASMTAAYDALPDKMKQRLDGLQAVQSIVMRYEKTEQAGIKKDALESVITSAPEAIHPVVRPHPLTGRKCLFVSEGYTQKILGIPGDESEALISELSAYCVEPRFQYRHSYQVDDLLMWDDSSTQHKATFDYALPQRRLMHRTTIGEASETA